MYPDLRYAGSADAGGGGGDGDGEELPDAGVHVVHLGDEDGGDGLVQRCAVHVDGGADGEDEPGDPGVHLAALLQAAHLQVDEVITI